MAGTGGCRWHRGPRRARRRDEDRLADARNAACTRAAEPVRARWSARGRRCAPAGGRQRRTGVAGSDVHPAARRAGRATASHAARRGGPPGSPWAPPDQSSGSWGTPPPEAGGRLAVPGAPGLVYAGAIPRAAAWIVDSFLLGILVSIVTIPFAASAFVGLDPTTDAMPDFSQLTLRSGIAAAVAVVIEAAYFIFFWMSAGRATLGMRLFNLQVGNAPDGARLRPDQAGKRWLAYGSWLGLASLAPAFGAVVGLVQLGWTLVLLVTTASSPTKQGLHDRFAGSAVVRPASAGNGLAITCLIVALALPLLLLFLLVPLIFLGSQVSDILSAVGDSI